VANDDIGPSLYISEQPLRQLFAGAFGAGERRGRLRGRNVLVVGAGQRPTPHPETTIGNGRAMSILFAREGANVACADADAASAHSTVDMVTAVGGTAIALEADVTEPAAIERMFDDAQRAFGEADSAANNSGGSYSGTPYSGTIDAVVANVGIASGRNLVTESPETWDQVMNVNLRAHMLIGQRALRSLSPGGAILFISSLASMSPAGRNPAYEASKAALSALCRAVALEGQTRGIRANALAPGLLDTPMGRAASDRQPARAARPLPFGRQGTAWEMAYVALFLISTEASYVNAQTVFVDGGLGSGVVLAPSASEQRP
jgi:NAD(P)-dependent dehydrogenase (short-subunit alcohol dehydrogenase family)